MYRGLYGVVREERWGWLTSLLPRPKPSTTGPERRIGKGGEGPVVGPAVDGRTPGGGCGILGRELGKLWVGDDVSYGIGF